MYISTKSEILCSFVSRYYDATFVFISLRFLFHFCRAVTKSRGPGIFPGYFHRKQKENRARRTSWLYNPPPTNRIYPATWKVSDSPVNDFFTFSCSFRFPWVFRFWVCVINSQFLPICYLLTWPAKGEKWPSVLCWSPSPLSPLPSLFSSPLSPKEGLILRLLRLRSKSNSLSEPFYINHTIFL